MSTLHLGAAIARELAVARALACCQSDQAALDEAQIELATLLQQCETWRIGHERYETARRLNPQQWADAWRLNISTGKPFDAIIDDLRPFFRA